MGSVMLAATLIGRTDKSLDFTAGSQAIETVDFADYDENAVQELLFEFEQETEGITDDVEAARKALQTAVDQLEEAIFDGDEITYHSYGEIDIYIAGGPSNGDASPVQRAMWTIQNFGVVHDALGFVRPDLITIKEDA